MSKTLRIGELAKSLDTTAKTIRFYERIGLLGQPTRSRAHYRLYDANAVQRARLVIGLRRLGLTIDDLKTLVNDRGEISQRQALLVLMDDKLRELELTLGVLQGRRDDLAARHQALLSTPRDRPPDCVCDALLQACTCGKASDT